MGGNLTSGITKLAHRYGGYIPLSRLNTISRRVEKKENTLLDIGCNDGLTMLFINRHKKYQTMGLDISKECIKKASSRKSHDNYTLGNALYFPFSEKSYDAVLCLQMLEHLHKEDGAALIAKMERIALNTVIISTPVGFHELLEHPKASGADHKSGWTVDDFKKRGYKVNGNKLRIEKHFGNFIYKRLPVLIPLHSLIWLGLGVLLAPLPYFFPATFAFDMVCVKNLNKERAAG